MFLEPWQIIVGSWLLLSIGACFGLGIACLMQAARDDRPLVR